MNVFFDFETRSVVDLRKCGTDVYASHPTTDILCLGYAFDAGPVKMWKMGDPAPNDLLLAVKGLQPMIAHNAAFEFQIWNKVCTRYGWPPISISQLHCTMTMGYQYGLPGSLDQMAQALQVPAKKDMGGHRVMLQLSQPRSCLDDGTPVWWDEKDEKTEKKKTWIREKYQALYDYCAKDIVVEREIFKRVKPLSPTERAIWELDQKINLRGVYIDNASARSALKIIDKEVENLNARMRLVTNGDVQTCRAVSKIKNFVLSKGVETESIDKASILAILNDENTPGIVKEVLKLRQEAGKSSTAKINAMLQGRSEDGRVRGCFQYYGAPSTGRWAGRRIQLQNMPRPNIKQHEVEIVLDLVGRVA